MDKKKQVLPNPKRFTEFCEFPDRSGFELKTGEKFYYEEDGGWLSFLKFSISRTFNKSFYLIKVYNGI